MRTVGILIVLGLLAALAGCGDDTQTFDPNMDLHLFLPPDMASLHDLARHD